MLAINTGTLSSLFLFYRTVTCPPFGLNPVLYLVTIVARAIDLISKGEMYRTLCHRIIITKVAQAMFSVLINISATSIIALKAWCVRVHGVFWNFLDYALVDDMACPSI